MIALPADASAALAKLSEADTRAVLLGFGLRAALHEFDRQRAEKYATQLLAQRCTRAQVRVRLMQRYGVSERSAYRHIDAAMQSLNPAKSCLVMADGGRILNTPPLRQYTQ